VKDIQFIGDSALHPMGTCGKGSRIANPAHSRLALVPQLSTEPRTPTSLAYARFSFRRVTLTPRFGWIAPRSMAKRWRWGIRAEAGPLYELKQRPATDALVFFRARREAERRGILDFLGNSKCRARDYYN